MRAKIARKSATVQNASFRSQQSFIKANWRSCNNTFSITIFISDVIYGPVSANQKPGLSKTSGLKQSVSRGMDKPWLELAAWVLFSQVPARTVLRPLVLAVV